MNGDTIRTITIRGQSEGLDKLTADVNKLAAAQENVAVVSEQSAKRVLSLEDAWKRQTLRLDEAARAQNNIARETKLADAALKEGLATQAQHAQRLEQINQRYTKTADATKVVTQQTGLARHELVNLGRQAQDVGVSLMSGQSPFTVLVQQGTQIADVFATSTSSLSGFFTQAIGWAKGFFTSTLGIVTAVGAVGAAAVYVASQFMSSSKTTEQALEEQNRLLKEGKTLIDARSSAEAKFNAQPPNITRFENLRAELDLAKKLKEVSESLQSKVTTPSNLGMPEMGIAPDVSTRAAPGMEKVRAAIEDLVRSTTEGKPKVAEFVDELARITIVHPELAKTTEEIIKLGGPVLENAVFKARALEDALKGVASSAQLAALGFTSLAQFQLHDFQAKEAAAATERQAVATLQIAAQYSNMSVEVAKQLNALQGQLQVAQARTGAEQIVTQEYVTQVTLLAQGKTAEEAMAIAAGQRAIAEANVTKTIADQILGLNQQIALSQARIAGTEAVVAAEQAYENAIRAGASALQASELAATSRRASAQQKEEAASNRTGQSTARALNTLEEYKEANAEVIHDYKKQSEAVEDIGDEIQRNTGYQQQFNQQLAAGYHTALEWFKLGVVGLRLPSQFEEDEKFSVGTAWGLAIERSNKFMEDTFGAENLEYDARGIADVKVGGLTSSMEDLTTSTDSLSASTDSLNATMQDALSPYYSQDPRTTKLGFRAGVTGNPDWMTGATNANPLVAVLGSGATAPGMADGGSFTVGGGYSANDNRMAVFPVASGEQVVVNRNREASGGQVVNIDNRIVINGSVDTDTLSQMKVSRYQQAQRIRAGLRA